MPWMPVYRTLTDIKRSNRTAGFHFFDSASMRFFDSVLVRGGPYKGVGGCFFVTSEQFHGSQGSAPRGYTVRQFNTSTADIHTIGRFNEIRTAEDARALARRYAKHGIPAEVKVLP